MTQIHDQLHIEFMLTYACTFRCAYCYEKTCDYSKLNMSEDVLNQSMDYIRWYLKEYPKSTITIDFWGGEPTLKIDIIERVIEEFMDEPRVSFFLFTNGSTNVDKIIELSHRVNDKIYDRFQIQISYDFYVQKRRIMANNSSSKELVLSTIRRFVQEKLPFKLKSTMMLEDLPLIDKVYDEYVELRNELDSPNIDLTITPDTMAIYAKPSAEFDDMIKRFHISFVNLLKKAIKNNDHGFSWLTFSGTRRLCTAGKSYMSVDIDGKIYPCHSVLFLNNKEQYSIGNITEHKIHDLPFDVNVEPEKCKNCDTKICFRCNAHSLAHSDKKTYAEKWVDHGWSENYCRVVKEISKMAYAYTKILTGSYTV